MSFQVTVSGFSDLSKLQLATDVAIDRRIYDHSHALVTLFWHEDSAFSEQQTAGMAAQILGCTIDVQWKGHDLSESVDCFHGYVERSTGERTAGRSSLTLECVSMSKRTDMAPRYRAFQSTTLSAICSQVAATEPLIKIDQSSDLNFDIPLSIQYGETDFAYVSRMLHAWGIPMSVDYSGEVMLGARGAAASSQFPDVDFRWTSIAFVGSSAYYSKVVNSGSGPSKSARGQVTELVGQVPDKAVGYAALEDIKLTGDRLSGVQSQVNTAYYHLVLEGGVLPFAPGDVVKFEGQDTIIREVKIIGDPDVATARQEFILQPFTLPYQPERSMPVWPSRALWAWVTDNEKDPTQSGRVEVKFEFEDLDPQSSSDRVWLSVITPYGGGKSPSSGKAGSYNGFYSVPEIGERVLVEFLGDWDSDAVVLGAVRDQSVGPMYDPKDTKRWRLPSGTEIAMTSKGSTEIVRLRCKDKIFFESKMDGPNAEVYITPGQSDDDIIHFAKGAGPPALNVLCSGNITVVAKQNLHLEGMMVQVKASGGNVNLDGAPMVMINCVPMPAMPLVKQMFQEDTLSTSTKERKLPTLPVGTAATAPPPTQKQDDPEKPVTWIEIVLKDNAGNPIPNERYVLKLPDGSTREGSLDGQGRARVDGIQPGSARVSFPDVDANEWKPA